MEGIIITPLKDIQYFNQLSRLNKVICLGVYLTIFISSIVLTTSPFEFYLGYIVMIGLFPFFIGRFKIPPLFIYLSVFYLLIGFFNIYFGNNTFRLFFKVYLGVFFSYLFYYYVIEAFAKNVHFLFSLYLKGAYLMTFIGLIQLFFYLVGFEPGYNYSWFLTKSAYVAGGNLGIRINSLYTEPSQYAIIQAPALFVAFIQLINKEYSFYTTRQCILTIIMYVLSFSGVGFVGLFITLVLLTITYGKIRYLTFSLPFILLITYYLYNNVDEFKSRFDDTTTIFSTSEFELGKSHGSSIILYDNFVVALENFKKNPLFGTGLGSHQIAFKKYSITKHIREYGFSGNSADANSMFLRIVSESGLMGVVLLIWFLYRFYIPPNTNSQEHYWVYSNGILVLIALFLFRQGHYFINGFPFFALLYAYLKSASEHPLSDAKN